MLSQVRQRVRPRSHSSATRIAEVLAELELLHDDTTAAIRTWIDRGTGELPDGFRRDIRAWLVVLLDGDARARPRSHTTLRSTSAFSGLSPRGNITAGSSVPATCGLPATGNWWRQAGRFQRPK